MPLTNAINKNSDTFFATSNITANFTSPVTSTITSDATYTNGFANIIQSTNRSAFTTEYYGAQSATVGNGSTVIFFRALGTKASPTGILGTANANNTLIGQIRFDALKGAGATNDNCMAIASYANANTGGFIQFVTTTGGAGFRVNSNGRVDISNNLTVSSDFDTTPTLTNTINPIAISKSGISTNGFGRFCSNSTNNHGLIVGLGSTTNYGGYVTLARSKASWSSSTAVVTNDELGSINYAGVSLNSSTSVTVGASISSFVDNTVSSGVMPSRLVFFTANAAGTLTEAMRIDSAQRITQPLQPSFSASLSADVASATGDGTAYVVALNTEQYDQGSNFAANTFTAPIAGKYRFAYTISVDDLLVGHTKMVVEVGGRVVERCNPYALADSDGFYLCSGMVDLSLAASATVTMVVTISGSTKTVTVKGTTTSGTFLSGQLQV